MYIKMVNKHYQKKTKKNFEKKNTKDIKIFLKKKKENSKNKNLPEEEKQNKVEYTRNYYLAHQI